MAMIEQLQAYRIIRAVIDIHEGGYVNDPDDPGGETKYGISKKAYPALDIAKLSIEEAERIYYQDYWLKIQAGQYQDLGIAAKVFDMAVNLGVFTAVRLLQTSINMLIEQRVAVDGVVGKETLSALGIVHKRGLNDPLEDSLIQNQTLHYQSLIQRNPKLEKFKNGWLARARWLYDYENIEDIFELTEVAQEIVKLDSKKEQETMAIETIKEEPQLQQKPVVTSALTGEKPAYKSKGVVGGVGALLASIGVIIASISKILGYDIDEATAIQLTTVAYNTLEDVVILVSGIIGAITATVSTIGRYTAETRIK